MAKLIDSSKSIWYQEVAPRSYYNESALERAILHNLGIIFPDFTAIPFKKELIDSISGKKNTADLAMIHKDYNEWYVIEVELGAHDIKHVVEQVTTFKNCNYDDSHANYIFEKAKKSNIRLDLNKLKSMTCNHFPHIMVIVNEHKPDWNIHFKAIRCKSCVFQIYHNFNGNALYRIDGEHPLIKTEFCHCKYQNTLPYTIEVLDKKFLDAHNILDGRSITIEYNGIGYSWERIDASNMVFLQCNHSSPPLDPLNEKYRLNYHQSGVITIKKRSKFIPKWLEFFIPNESTKKISTFSLVKD